MERLSSNTTAASNPSSAGLSAASVSAAPELAASFKQFNDCISTLIEERANMSLTETLRLQTVLTNFALKCHPSKIDYVAHCLSTSSAMIEKTDFAASVASGSAAVAGGVYADTTQQIEALLSTPLSSLALRVLDIPAYGKLMSHLPWSNWKEVAANLLRAVISNPLRSPLAEVSQVEQLLNMISPLLRDRDSSSSAGGAAESQQLVRP